jgi:glycosyltransferase involved in cell wall biosynthesis
MAVPERAYVESTLKERVARSGAHLTVHEIPGGRLAFQARSLVYLWKVAPDFDVILSQEVLRGSLNATVVGALRSVPVVTTMALPPVEYFRCRGERGQIGPLAAWAGELAIRTMMSINGRLATRCLALGPYLERIASEVCPRTETGYYYGVDVDRFRPVSEEERRRLRARLRLPRHKFLIVLASRISHEKDPETVLQAVALARTRGLDAVLLNLGGGYQEFLALAGSLGIADADSWVLARPAVHPMQELADYFRAADVLVQGSLEEGLGLSPLEALACETPVVATAVGGMAAHLGPYAALTPRRDAEAMARAILEVDADPCLARIKARHGREYVRWFWSRERAFRELRRSLFATANRRDRPETRQAA